MTQPKPSPGIVLAAGILAAGLAWSLWRTATSVRLDEPPAPVNGIAWRVDLNTAPAHELELLPGLGPRLAARIVADRTALGPYGSVAEMARVPGIGPATIEAITPHAVVRRPGWHSGDAPESG